MRQRNKAWPLRRRIDLKIFSRMGPVAPFHAGQPFQGIFMFLKTSLMSVLLASALVVQPAMAQTPGAITGGTGTGAGAGAGAGAAGAQVAGGLAVGGVAGGTVALTALAAVAAVAVVAGSKEGTGTTGTAP
jgi:hypothetical protein